MTVLLGIDIGTSTTRAIIYSPEQGKITARAHCPTPTSHPRLGYSEHEPDALWDAVVQCVRGVLAQTQDRSVSALSISSFGEAGLPMDSAHRPLYPIIAWYDRRCESQVEHWERGFSPVAAHAITGQPFSTALGVNKWLWLCEHEPEIAKKTAHWLSVPDYLLWRLTGRLVTDYSIASRTGLLDQHTGTWSSELMAFAGLTPLQLPTVLPAGVGVDSLTCESASQLGLPMSTTVVLGGHDHLCAALAAGGYQPGVVIDSAGTAQALLLLLPRFESSEEIASSGYACAAHVVPNCYALRGGLKAGGGSIAWLTHQLAGFQSEVLPYNELEATAGEGVGRRVGPFWLPHLLGSGTPYGDRHSQAALVGLRFEHTRGDLFRSLLEALAFWLRQNLETMSTLTGQSIKQLVLLGGTTRIRLLARLKAATLKMPVTLPALSEPSALGAALLASLGCDTFGTPAEAVSSLRHECETIEPEMELMAWYEALYQEGYASLYETLHPLQKRLTKLTQTLENW